ncbi:GNAT family N-acetyltransferase [Flavobacterium sp.]|uniref:GNAT family N-acetyltransferase n=1 Tax=Flavobacterium sp. TaxID=239 RepID=UPI003752DAB8
MKKYNSTRLDWDSNFFKIEVGELIADNASNDDNYFEDKFDLIIVKQVQDKSIKIKDFENNFQETKVIFSKKLNIENTFILDETILDIDVNEVKNSDLYPLAFESGKFSRFKLDTNFSNIQFENLYKKWIDNSLNKQYADKVFYIIESNIVQGFVTVKLNKMYATIGLIAVLDSSQGRGFGTKLLKKVEAYCISNSILELQIPTQKENNLACNFYNKLNYNIIEETIIKHFWKLI